MDPAEPNDFERFGLQPRPDLDPDQLHQEFLARSSALHPDRVHHHGPHAQAAASDRMAALTAAYHRLREPRTRLAYLVLLLTGSPPPTIQPVSGALGGWMFELAVLLREADAQLACRPRDQSPLLTATWLAAAGPILGKLKATIPKLRAEHDAAIDSLRRIDSAWPPADPRDPSSLQPLLELHARFSFAHRSTEHVQSRIAQFFA